MENSVTEVLKCFDRDFFSAFFNISENVADTMSEIRVRSGKPVVIFCGSKPYFISKNGDIVNFSKDTFKEDLLTTDNSKLKNAFYKLCEYSVYKRQGEINNGFITVGGGHRIGVCGTAAILDNRIKSVTDISSLNIRIARQYLGCSNKLFDCGALNNGCLIVGVPSSGKTTLLRDIARRLTLEHCFRASVIDERFELSASYNGMTHFDLGLSDVYSGYPKKLAIIQAVRSMSPNYIICDELTGDDIDSVASCVNFGVKMIASVHCDCFKNIVKNKGICALIKTGAFERLVFLDKLSPCTVSEILKTEELKLD